MKEFLKILLIIVAALILRFIVMTGIVLLFTFGTQYEKTNDITKYNDVIGNKAKGVYENKWGMGEDIFPSDVESLDVKDFKMIYYDPWDKQYLSYLVVDYDEEALKKEVERLERIGIDKYIGYYGTTGFSKYKLLSMKASSYNGFIYAINKDNRIIYVEMIFCNYYMDIDYKKNINPDYLPDGFDATVNNKYRESMLN